MSLEKKFIKFNQSENFTSQHKYTQISEGNLRVSSSEGEKRSKTQSKFEAQK